MLVSFLLIIVVVVAIVRHYKNYFKSVVLAFKIPGPPALPILGHTFFMRDNNRMIYMAENMSDLYGPIAKMWISIFPMFVITEPSHLQIILSTSKYSEKSVFYSFLTNFLGDGLAVLTGEKWKFHRRLIQPYFQINVLKNFFKIFEKYSEDLVDALKNKTDVNIVPFANKFVVNVMHEIVYGIPIKDENEASVLRSCKVSLLHRICRPWLLFNTVFNLTNRSKQEAEHRNGICEYTEKLLKIRKKELQDQLNITDRSSLVDMMMEIPKHNSAFTEKDVIDEIASFIVVGQDSVATSLAFTLYFLAAHQDVQDKVVEELKGIYRTNDHVDSFEDLNEMRYLDQCLKESLRLCPSVPLFTRTLTKEVRLENKIFPVGTNIAISPFITHRLPHIFRNPSQFNPDRFSPENKQNINAYDYIPFSMGPRNCIGYKFALIQMKIVISHILRNYHVSLTPGHENLNLVYTITLKARGGIWLRLQKRDLNLKN